MSCIVSCSSGSSGGAALVNVLAGSGYRQSKALYRVAQAISVTLPDVSRETKLLDGLRTGRE
jgi:hypothetical protein